MLRTLRAVDFRCFEVLALDVPAAGAILLGDNAQGKTSVLEAVCLLTRLHSPRTHRNGAMVRFQRPGYGIAGEVWGQERQIRYGKDGFAFKVDGEERGSQGEYLSDGGLVVWMGNEDLELVRGGGEIRRRYLDFLGCQVDPAYRRALARYRRALKAKNLLLKDARPREREIASYEEILADNGSVLMRVRDALIEALSPQAAEAQARVSGRGERLSLVYRPAGGNDLRASFAQAREKELRLRQTVVGPHRDDLELLVNGLPASEYASEGQQRTLALALKLAQGAVLESHGGKVPVYLIDDVFGELDPQRRNALMQSLPAAAQKWITTTTLSWLEEENSLQGLQRFAVNAGHVSPA